MPTGQYDRSHLKKKGKKAATKRNGATKALRDMVKVLERENSDLRDQLAKAKLEASDTAAAALRTIDRALAPR